VLALVGGRDTPDVARRWAELSAGRVTVWNMTKHASTPESAADLLMLSGVVRECPDCDAEQIFMPVDDGAETPHDLSASAYCCSACGAAILVDLFDEPAAAAVRGVA
jgi:hypothetical protein